MMKNSALVFALLLAHAASGCTSELPVNTRQAGSSPSPIAQVSPVSTMASPSVTPIRADETSTAAEPFKGTDGVTDKRNVGIKGNGVLADVRHARHEGYDRVVFEFLGAEMPGFHVEYVGKGVTQCGSGDPVGFDTAAMLEVRFTDALAHAPEGDATIKDRDRTPNLPSIKRLKIICDFEGEVTWLLGLPSREAYRVMELKNPTRFVVDIKHP